MCLGVDIEQTGVTLPMNSNAMKRYRRAGKLGHVSDEPTAELAVIRQEVPGRA